MQTTNLVVSLTDVIDTLSNGDDIPQQFLQRSRRFVIRYQQGAQVLGIALQVLEDLLAVVLVQNGPSMGETRNPCIRMGIESIEGREPEPIRYSTKRSRVTHLVTAMSAEEAMA